jgi:hypothetical protein
VLVPESSAKPQLDTLASRRKEDLVVVYEMDAKKVFIRLIRFHEAGAREFRTTALGYLCNPC